MNIIVMFLVFSFSIFISIYFAHFQGCKWSLQQLRRYLVAKHGMEKVTTTRHCNIVIRQKFSDFSSVGCRSRVVSWLACEMLE